MLLEQAKHIGYVGAVKDIGVGDSVGPHDIQDASQITMVEDVEKSFLSTIQAPCFAVVAC